MFWAYLDTGSRRNFISKEAAKKLNLNPIRHESRHIVTVNGTKKQSMPIYDVTINSIDSKASKKIEITGSKLTDFTTIKRPTLSELKEKYQHVSRSQCRRRVALGTGVHQVNHSEALGGQQDSMTFIKIRLVRLFTALAVKTRKKRAIFTSDETKNYDNAPCTKKEGKTNY